MVLAGGEGDALVSDVGGFHTDEVVDFVIGEIFHGGSFFLSWVPDDGAFAAGFCNADLAMVDQVFDDGVAVALIDAVDFVGEFDRSILLVGRFHADGIDVVLAVQSVDEGL